jgi:alkanesulfonate monooxygenase SsuD/methylene tetrahydromethanopterin reductase-like flavin-dependent oxidoreductase (luciferase family)
MTTFGFTVPQRGALFGLGPLRQILAMGRDAEASGLFDTLWIGDSLTSKSRPESLTCLGALAGSTERIRLAVGCLASFALRDPVLFALQWATLDQISEGRMLLTVCNGLQPAGASAREGGHFGGVRDVDRTARLEENIDLCRSLWSGDLVTFNGRFHHYDDIQIEPIPLQSPCPIWISSNPRPGRYFERALQRVARYGEGWMTTYPGAPAFEVLRAGLHEALDEAGRDRSDFPIALYHNINIGRTRAECLAETKHFADNYYGPGFLDAALDNMTVGGEVSECVDQLLALSASGIDHIALRLTSFDQPSQFRLLTEEVLPAVASHISVG